MILIQCVTAYRAVTQQMEVECSYQTAYALLMLKKALQPHIDFFTQQEAALVDKYGAKNERGRVDIKNGTFQLAEGVSHETYEAARIELCGVEVDMEWTPRKVKAPSAIKPVNLEALSDFLEFEGGD